MEEFIVDTIRDMDGDASAVFVFLGLIVIIIISVIGFFLLSWSWIIAIIGVLIGFIVWRHISIKNKHPRPSTGRRWISRRERSVRVPDTTRLPAAYFLYILGSGGHTTEMIDTIKHQFQAQRNIHRRYLVNKGDSDSLRRVVDLELLIKDTYASSDLAGTLDTFSVPRARHIHQPFYTAPLSCLSTAIHAINALTCEPLVRPTTLHGAQYKYPHVVVTNGPATGFIVCLVAHLLKVFYVVPQTRLKMVYVESWARSKTLSLTGRLFLWTGIADMFCVQHEELARRVRGSVYVGQVAARIALKV
ncbi:UDP-N-acetylglucosamine transferase subunit [Collariella sp. IMI 366227]|nr:UDP-N-acetylglucosamine transferase subunit [Collariella sp. IMI 366227]